MNEVAILEVLRSTGPVGACLIAAFWGLRYIQLKLNDVQEKRVADAQIATAKLLELVTAQHTHMELLAKAIDANADAIQQERALLESMLTERSINRAPLPPIRRGT